MLKFKSTIKMCKIRFFIIVILCFVSCSFIYGQVGISTTNPQAALDIDVETLGLLPPRVKLVRTDVATPITNPVGGNLVDGTIVYNTETINDVTPGYYYWEVDKWVRFVSECCCDNDLTFAEKALAISSGTNNNVNLELTSTNAGVDAFKINHNGASIAGISNGTHGRLIYLYNGSSNKNLTLRENDDANGTNSINRFSIKEDYVMGPGMAALIFYDGLYLKRWIVVKFKEEDDD